MTLGKKNRAEAAENAPAKVASVAQPAQRKSPRVMGLAGTAAGLGAGAGTGAAALESVIKCLLDWEKITIQ